MFDLVFYAKLKMAITNLVESFSPSEILTVCKSEFKKHMNLQWENNYLASCCEDERYINYIKLYINYFKLECKRTYFENKFISN